MSAAAHSAPVAPPAAEVRGLRRSLVTANDAQVIGAVRLVDAMQDRGTADELIAPLRPRLAQLRPERPFTPMRLLFTPLDGVIVPATQWKPGALAVPRQALQPLAEIVWGGAAAAAAAGGGKAPALPRDNPAELAKAGAGLWALAADRLARAAPSAETGPAHGIPVAEFALLVRGAAAAMRHGVVVVGLPVLDAAAQQAAAAAVLADVAARDPGVVGLVTAVLLARLPNAAGVLDALSRLEGKLPPGGAEAIGDRVLDGLERRLDGVGRPGAAPPLDAEGAHRLVDQLAALEAQAPGPARRQRVNGLRRQADAACRESFRRVLGAGVTERVAELLAGSEPADSRAVAALEATARGVRALEQAGRTLGSGASYDAALQAAAAPLATVTGKGLTLADRVRLTEILVGLEAALALCEAPPRA